MTLFCVFLNIFRLFSPKNNVFITWQTLSRFKILKNLWAHLFRKKVFILWYFLVCDSYRWRISMKWKIRNLIFDRMKDIWWDGYLISDAELWFVMETFELIENLYLMEDIRWWLDQLPNCFAISINKDLDCAFCTVHTVHTMLFHSGKNQPAESHQSTKASDCASWPFIAGQCNILQWTVHCKLAREAKEL